MVTPVQQYVLLSIAVSVLVAAPIIVTMRYLKRNSAKREPVKWFGIGFGFGVLCAIFGRDPIGKLIEALEKFFL